MIFYWEIKARKQQTGHLQQWDHTEGGALPGALTALLFDDSQRAGSQGRSRLFIITTNTCTLSFLIENLAPH